MGSNLALELAGEVTSLLREEHTRALVIGAIALAAHGYVRGTEDVDLAIAVNPNGLEALARRLQNRLAQVEIKVELPTPDDPLGGVVNLRRTDGTTEGLVQVVNFDNAPGGGFPALVLSADAAPFSFPDGGQGELVSAEDLVFFKLYAGGTKSRADVEELLVRKKLDVEKLRSIAQRYRMTDELQAVLGSG